MLKKTVLTLFFLTIFTTFYGFNTDLVSSDMELLADNNSLLIAGEYEISAYDNIIRNVSEKEGNDWRLMSAIAYHESRFTPDIVSHRGARGLMQIMPAVARQFNIPSEEVSNPKTNVWLANKLLNRITRTLQLPQDISAQDRLSIILACYNGGIGHVTDARRLARAHGEDPNSWASISHYLALKSDPEYYGHEVVKSGRFTGSRQTLAYVDDVMEHYNKYCRIADR